MFFKSHLLIITVLATSMILSCDVIRPFLLSEDDEIQLGNKFKTQILADTRNYPQYNGNSSVVRFVDSIGQRIADAQNDRPSLPFTFTIIRNDTEVNAFSILGGHVFVYTGLLKAADNTAELAGVLAHEIGHITKYHGADQLIRNEGFSIINQILFGDDSSSVAIIAGLLENMTFLHFSQKKEYQADSCAVAYTTKTKINPYGMKQFLSYLRNRYGNTPKIFEPFSEHPPLDDRIDKVQSVINKTSGVMDSTQALFRNEYQRMKAML